MKIVCATNMPYAEEAFSRLGEVSILAPDAITEESVRDADALCVRSTTLINSSLLKGSKVCFVGTATIGIDHMDTGYLDRAGIAWCSAAGCNANSVSEYVMAALLCLAGRNGFRLQGKTIGVVGVGNVGKRVVRKARALGMNVLLNDPPRQEIEGGAGFQPLDVLLRESDVVTLHTPLTNEGSYKTLHLADEAFFSALKPGSLFINSARGSVLDSDALLRASSSGAAAQIVLDTWEGEPGFRLDVLEQADIATPHIAGHSFDGKVAGTVMVFRELCRFLGIDDDWSPDPLLPDPPVPLVRLDASTLDDECVIRQLVRAVYDVESDDSRLRAEASEDEAARRASFERLRREYPMRREFHFTRVELTGGSVALAEKIEGLGFKLDWRR